MKLLISFNGLLIILFLIWFIMTIKADYEAECARLEGKGAYDKKRA